MPQSLLRTVADHAEAYLEALPSARVTPTDTTAADVATVPATLPETGLAPEAVLEELLGATASGLMGSAGPRFFGWVIGGGLPASVAADWLTTVWDQNAGAFACSPAAAAMESRVGAWLLDVLDLPATASFALVTGCQIAHVTALAAARHHLLEQAGWDVERKGLAGSPGIRVLTTPHRHETLARALRLLGIGTDSQVHVDTDAQRRMDPAGLEAILSRTPKVPTVVALQAGDLNTGAFDRFGPLCEVAHRHGAWVHVDGAFGAWCAASPAHRHLTAGIGEADSWATDTHKWLNTPYDCGFAAVAHPGAHRGSFEMAAGYVIDAGGQRDAMNFNPEWSRRARAFPVYAAMRSLGREGIAALVDRCCRHATALVERVGALKGVEVLAAPVINQGVVRFLDPAGDDHDRFTDRVLAAIQADGRAWLGGTTWEGQRVMRVSVSNWQTSDDDVSVAVDCVRDALAQTRASTG